MTRAERQIRDALASEFANLQILAAGGGTLQVPAAHERVAPLQIQIDPDEITVFIGPTHCHFEHYDDEPEEKHVAEALQFIGTCSQIA